MKMLKIVLNKLFLFILLILPFFSIVYSNSVLDNAYGDKEHVIDSDPEELLSWSESSLVKIWKLLSQISIAVWFSIALYWWISFIMTNWDYSKFSKNRNKLFLSGAWIVLALASWIIMSILSSVAETIWTVPLEIIFWIW